MRILKRLFRFIRINLILMRYNIHDMMLVTPFLYPLRFFSYFNPYYWSKRNGKLTRGQKIRLALEELGPIFVKMGQILSTRRDLLPDDIAIELAKLQDRVPPFSGQVAKAAIEETLDCKIEDIFQTFDQTALASASIAQVHAATLLNGESVVVKVLRPNVRAQIESDLDLLNMFARLAQRYWPNANIFKPVQIVAEISQTLNDELDLNREGANASQLRRNFKNSVELHIPKIYWEYSRTTVLVMERVHGIPIHDFVALREAGVNLERLAEKGMEIFFTQVFRDCFFHADLHPGNIFVDATHPARPTYITVDFGIVGSLNAYDVRYLAENMIAFFDRDYQRVAELHIACGWLPPNTRIDQFEGAIRAVSEPIFEQPLKEVSFGKLLLRLFQVARRFQINIQPQFVLLQKTLLNVEGLSRSLAPELDVWAAAAPQIEHWLKRQVGFKSFLKRIRQNLPLWSEQFPALPNLVYEVLRETKYHQEERRFNENVIKRKTVANLKGRYYLFGIATGLAIGGLTYYLMLF